VNVTEKTGGRIAMSRGFGVWQRKILEALKTHEALYVCDLLPKGYRTAQRLAVTRAAHRLAALGHVVLRVDSGVSAPHLSRVVVAQPGVALTRDYLNRLCWARQGYSQAKITYLLSEQATLQHLLTRFEQGDPEIIALMRDS
jgi:hypothetical protein